MTVLIKIHRRAYVEQDFSDSLRIRIRISPGLLSVLLAVAERLSERVLSVA
jgi:hypothetical protein